MDWHVNHSVYLVWGSALLTFVVLLGGARTIAAATVSTGRFAGLVEAMVDFVRVNIVEEFLGEHARKWFGFFAALFFFLLFANLLGKLPGPIFGHGGHPVYWLESPTGNITVTAALALFVCLVAWSVGVVKLGPWGWFKRKFLLPAPWWVQIPAIPIMLLVLLAEPFSLAVRLFANMTAGHRVIVTFAIADLVGGVWLASHPNVLVKAAAALPFALTVVLLAFELFVAFIQAFIFTLLSALYLSESLEEHH